MAAPSARKGETNVSETYSSGCECSEDYGPCEAHCIVLAQREGASVRTADELAAVYIGDVLSLIAEALDNEASAALSMARADAERYWAVCPNGGWVPIDDEDYSLADALRDSVMVCETYAPGWTFWDDGFRIVRVTGGPLIDDGCCDACNGREACECEHCGGSVVETVRCGMCWRVDVVYVDGLPTDPSTGEPHYCAGMSDR